MPVPRTPLQSGEGGHAGGSSRARRYLCETCRTWLGEEDAPRHDCEALKATDEDAAGAAFVALLRELDEVGRERVLRALHGAGTLKRDEARTRIDAARAFLRGYVRRWRPL